MTETTDPMTAASNAVWVDGDPLMETMAAAVWAHCDTETGIVADDPRTIAAVAAAVAGAMQAAPEATPPADLRDRIAEAVRGVLPMSSSLACDVVADAVLGVLPAPADRATVLAEAATRYEEILANANTGQDPRYWTAVRDITLGLRNMADEAQPTTKPEPDGLRCVCGDPVQLMDESDPTSWIHSPGSDTRCLEARPRCPHCQMPHDLTPSVALACASIRASITDGAPAVVSEPGKEA